MGCDACSAMRRQRGLVMMAKNGCLTADILNNLRYCKYHLYPIFESFLIKTRESGGWIFVLVMA